MLYVEAAKNISDKVLLRLESLKEDVDIKRIIEEEVSKWQEERRKKYGLRKKKKN
ncbi:hypothetical protein [Clostridium perfringens]|uniref:hypothetical protein n=1 Tax=Clostridium phage phiSM101 TaxID=396359 RepID=UPI0000DB682A|nr:hypothetical protein [Clostridium perfringens]YP_699963.1 hypothetical protein CPR_C0035 [Clostridium phage phiSM101]ABG87893.1 hypothetical protein CPR_C0035 [Clostridium phage phiSM101]MDK3122626.1 hypothetical protein [Clostridium perfringens]SQB59714.1 Uncharacterised protein [Clostridium perfringens]